MFVVRTGRPVFRLALLLLLSSPSTLFAHQEATREDENRVLREKKATALAPDKQGRIEGVLLRIQERKLREKLETPGAGYKGFRPRLGGLSTGSGFGFGFQYDRPGAWKGQLDFTVVGAVSTRLYQLYSMKFDYPRLWNNHGFLSVDLRYRNMPRIAYFGLGPKSRRRNRTSYLYEDTSYEVAAGIKPLSWFRLGSRVGWIKTNVGSGTDPRFPSTEKLFNDLNTPGLARQSDFLRSEVFAEVDYRDAPGNPRRGGFVRASYSAHDDRKFNQYDFRRFEGEFQHYVPFNYGHRVVAFRFFTSLDDAKSGHQVPFYLQNSLGGSNDLRGFREFRFRDLNQMVFNLEYRWEAFAGLDMALFGDAGKVFRDRSDFDFEKLEGDFGIGLRFNTAKSVFMRLDIGHSREGTRIFFKFNHVF